MHHLILVPKIPRNKIISQNLINGITASTKRDPNTPALLFIFLFYLYHTHKTLTLNLLSCLHLFIFLFAKLHYSKQKKGKKKKLIMTIEKKTK